MILVENELATVKKNRLFAGLNERELESSLDFFKATRKEYQKGAVLNHCNERLERFGLVIRGNVLIETASFDGRQMIMASVSASETFGESLEFLSRSTDIYITASCDSCILWLSTEKLRSSDAMSAEETDIARRFITILAERALSMNDRIQILSKNSIREKILAFLSDCMRKSGKRCFCVDFDRAELAAYLGCDRSALSRELTRLKSDGIINYRKNIFEITSYSE